jgi:hypothetical protein
MSRNLPNTEAYKNLKKEVQQTFDLSVISCYAIPALKQQISLVEKGVLKKLPKPDYYPEGNNSLSQLKEQSKDYKIKIAKFTLLSNFSFFEAFVSDAIKEMISFHGGIVHFKNKNSATLNMSGKNIQKSKQVLRGKPIMKEQRFRKHSQILKSEGYRFPSSLLSGIGVSLMLEKLDTMKSVDIPEFLVEGLQVPLTNNEIKDFHNARDFRNRIAHGKRVNLTLEKVSEMNNVLKQLAYKLDRHLNEHFMINENYA